MTLALDPGRAVDQYTRDAWSSDQGFPGGTVYSICQTPDGYLWIGGERGLVRFDGIAFHLLSPEDTPGWEPGPVQQLAVDASGALWVRRQDLALLKSEGDHFQNVLQERLHDNTGATAMYQTRSGDILLWSRTHELLRYHAGNLGRLFPVKENHLGLLVIAMAESKVGLVWLGARDQGAAVWRDGRLIRFTQELPDLKVNAILPISGSDVWMGTDGGVVRWDGTHLRRQGISAALQHVSVLTLVQDSALNVWAGSGRGLLRARAGAEDQVESLADSAINTVFEDREGNLWVGGDGGLERFRSPAFLNYPATPKKDFAKVSGPLFVDDEGRAWFGGDGGELFWRRGDQHGELKVGLTTNDAIYSISGRRGNVWVGTKESGLALVRCRRECAVEKRYTHKDGLAENSVLSVFESDDAAVWAGTVSSGLSKLQNGHFSTYKSSPGLVVDSIRAIAQTPDGAMWFGTAGGLTSLSLSHWRTYTGGDGLPSAAVNCLTIDPAGVLWVGTGRGLAFLRGGHIDRADSRWRSRGEEITGIAADRNGSIWLTTSKRVLRIRRDLLMQEKLTESDVRTYGPTDGVVFKSSDRCLHPITAGASGRVWLLNNGGLSVVDPARFSSEVIPPLVQIESVTADGRRIPSRMAATIPAGRRRIVFDYVGISLAAPQNVRYRYKLENFDRDWSEPVAMRQAVYTNLNPGAYRFHIQASNSAGIWSANEASYSLQVEPAFWQTWWFRGLFFLLLCLLGAATYQLKVRQVTRELDMRFEERLSERTRIARDLHDTLLQGFLSASMQLHVAAGRLEDGSPARAPLDRAIGLMSQAGNEGRAALRQLRSSQEDEASLETAFSAIPREIFMPDGLRFRLRVEGRPKGVRPVLRDEVYRICREAIVNAIRHSKATDVEVEVVYAPSELGVIVQDNGIGMDVHILQGAKRGHWGMQGMRERADRIGGSLLVRSNPGAGTEVNLTIPGHIAFSVPEKRSAAAWLRRALAPLRSRRDAERRDV